MKNNISVKLITLFFALPLSFVYLTIFVIYSELPQTGKERILRIAVSFGILMVSYSVFHLAYGCRNLASFIPAALVGLTFLVVVSVVAGVVIHRDFFTAAFQYTLSAPAFFIFYCTRDNKAGNLPQSLFRAASAAGFLLAIVYTLWILLMGFAIATRMEPRPMEALGYNIYNLILVILLFFLSRVMGLQSLRILIVGPESISVEGRSLVSLIGEKKEALLYAFISAPDQALRCPDLQRVMEQKGFGTNKRSCETCEQLSSKVTLCSKYRTTYNSILEIKKVLEFLDIGTIIAPDNRRNILEQGWKLRLFNNARILKRMH